MCILISNASNFLQTHINQGVQFSTVFGLYIFCQWLLNMQNWSTWPFCAHYPSFKVAEKNWWMAVAMAIFLSIAHFWKYKLTSLFDDTNMFLTLDKNARKTLRRMGIEQKQWRMVSIILKYPVLFTTPWTKSICNVYNFDHSETYWIKWDQQFGSHGTLIKISATIFFGPPWANSGSEKVKW